jgi:aldehyde dehydrogenase (NAD+)
MVDGIITKDYQVSLSSLQSIVPALRHYFDDGHTLDIEFRRKCIEKLGQEIEDRTEDICKAIYLDFHKPKGEMLLTEIFTTLAEIKHFVSNIDSWTSASKVRTNLLLMPASSKVYKSPKGVVLIIAPWNYPFYLSMMPLISAVAAGNCVVVKPASETYHTSIIIQQIIEAVFAPEHVKVITGEGQITGEMLLDNFAFNHIFFTGSARVGKWIMSKAAAQLTPLTLELGGKSPAIVDRGYDLDRAAKKIVWGKYINAGQTCVCTDYVLVHKSEFHAFVEKCIHYIKLFFGEDPLHSADYSHIINEARFIRLCHLMEQGDILYGGKTFDADTCIEPTLIVPHTFDAEIMKEEIFGPILPIITFETKEEVVAMVRRNRYPLSLYLFTNSSDFKQYIFDKIEFGGGCEHTTVYHLGNPHLPFGGIQNSGMGNYHGKYGVDTFSNLKPVLNTAKWFDIPLLYQPYTSKKINLLKRLFKF